MLSFCFHIKMSLIIVEGVLSSYQSQASNAVVRYCKKSLFITACFYRSIIICQELLPSSFSPFIHTSVTVLLLIPCVIESVFIIYLHQVVGEQWMKTRRTMFSILCCISFPVEFRQHANQETANLEDAEADCCI